VSKQLWISRVVLSSMELVTLHNFIQSTIKRYGLNRDIASRMNKVPAMELKAIFTVLRITSDQEANNVFRN
jgi:hypothetical protein